MCDSGKEPGGHLLQLVRDEGMKTGQKTRCGVNNRCRVVHKHLFAVMGRETGEGGNRASQCRQIMSQSKLQKQPKTFSRKAKKVSNV